MPKLKKVLYILFFFIFGTAGLIVFFKRLPGRFPIILLIVFLLAMGVILFLGERDYHRMNK